ncbi:MAG: hypothetical protein QFX36_07725 [Archaeoglobales archaeon]|nr:hypothetical protein [Archaeoglobales archaeon]MDI9641916.1 hypothetical protein [Archaeoglobales archaeon]
MILTDYQIKDRIVKDEEWKNKWKTGKWDEINSKILITDFEESNLELNFYTLRVGNQYIKLRNPDKVIESDKIEIEPGETVFILTKEYIALPKNITGFIVPKARWIFEGLMSNVTRVDPTWFGKLQIAVTNITKDSIIIPENEGLWCLYFVETYEVKKVLNKAQTPSLGREKLTPLKTTYHRPQRMLRPDQVTVENLEEVVEIYGKPWDILRGLINLTKEEVTRYVDYEKAPHIVEEAKNQAYKDAFKSMMTWLKILIGAIVALIATLTVGIIKMFFF